MKTPIIAVTMGDPSGIGPELVVKVLSEKSTYGVCRPLVIGDMQVFQQTAIEMNAPIHFREISSPSDAAFSWPVVDILCPDDLQIGSVPVGKVDPSMGKAAATCLKIATLLATHNDIHGIVSSPLNKEAFHLSGLEFRDELSYMAALTESRNPSIVGVMKHLWTITLTDHIPFKDIQVEIRKEKILRLIKFFNQILLNRGEKNPKIGVAGLNPHSGDGGLLGMEEIDEISPAIHEARLAGMDIYGPIPPDILFPRALQESFDGVVCMYHDQANIARKLQPKDESATLYMGFSFPCGTTAHGTAFDIAGQWNANPGSLNLVLRCVAQIAQNAQAHLNI